VLEGNICALLAAKDHVNVFLYDGAIVPDPEGIITGGRDNKTARTVAVREGEEINEPCDGRFTYVPRKSPTSPIISSGRLSALIPATIAVTRCSDARSWLSLPPRSVRTLHTEPAVGTRL
jgi:hypothetical protein